MHAINDAQARNQRPHGPPLEMGPACHLHLEATHPATPPEPVRRPGATGAYLWCAAPMHPLRSTCTPTQATVDGLCRRRLSFYRPARLAQSEHEARDYHSPDWPVEVLEEHKK